MEIKRCGSTRDHKPHWWSRTTRRTVTEETAGDTLQCLGRGRLAAGQAQAAGRDARAPQIAADARSGRNWAAEVAYGPACLCGMRKKTWCHRHRRWSDQR